MASRLTNQFINNFKFNSVFLEGSFQIGFNGAVLPGGYVGDGISASSTVTVQNMGTGVFRLQVNDPYYRIVGWDFLQMPGPSSSQVGDNSGNIVVGSPYQILGGTSALAGSLPSTATNWYTLGLYPGVNPAVGQVFVATSAASQVPGSSASLAGQGLVQAIGTTNISDIEVFPAVNTQLAPTSASSGVQGALLYFQTLRSSSTTNGSFRFNPSSCTIRYNLWMVNSSRRGYNESTTAS